MSNPRPHNASEFQTRANAVLSRYGAPSISLEEASYFLENTTYSVRQAVAVCLDVDPTNY